MLLQNWFARHSGVLFPQNLMAVDIDTYLPDDLLVKVDIASMACSLEARSPFLDHEMMEFAASLPGHLRITNRTTKYLLKKYLQDKIPQTILDRPKRGFGVPIRQWFRKQLLGRLKEVLLDDASIKRGYFDRKRLEMLIQRHASGMFDHTDKLYALLILELWHRTFVDHRRYALTSTASLWAESFT